MSAPKAIDSAAVFRGLYLALALGVLAAALTGCTGLTPGRLGNYAFGVELPTAHPTVRASFDVLLGSDATLAVMSGKDSAHGFDKAESSDPNVVEVLRIDASHVTLRARGEGDALLWVYGAGGASDYVKVRVRPAASVVLGAGAFGESRDDENPIAVLLGEQIRFSVRVEDASKTVLLAPMGVPLTVSPSGHGSVVPPFFAESVDVVFHERGSAVVRAAVGPPFSVDVIAPEDVEQLAVADATKFVGKNGAPPGLVVLVPVVTVKGVATLLLTRRLELHLRTPEVCAPVSGVPGAAPDGTLLGAVVLSLEPGRCEVELSAFGRVTTFTTNRPETLASPALR
ncbi:MAG: hypothetical protein U0414_41300 [Polyangiaceae bacterium]